MRIGIDASKMMPPRDGIGTYVGGLIEALAAAAAEHELRLFGSLHPLDPLVVEQRFGVLPDNLSIADRPAPRGGEVDVFHATSWLRPSGFDGPLLMTCYDTTVLSHPAAHQLANRVHCLSGLLASHLAGDTFLTLSQATARDLGHWLEVAPERIETVPAAVDARFKAPDEVTRAATLARFGVASPYVLAVGTREPRKNLDRLLDAWQGLPAATREQTPLVIVGGDGWGDPSLSARLGAAPGARLLGHVPDAVLPALYAAATVFVYPSLAEGFGFPVLEAMACGAPVITSNRSSLPEVAGDAAVLVDPEDTAAIRGALAAVLGDAALRARLALASTARAGDFSWPATARAVVACYQRLARGDA